MVIQADSGAAKISKFACGHSSGHLGRCIYDGYWVGRDSNVPNVRGIRTDIADALRKIRLPVLRWPGGCFAGAEINGNTRRIALPAKSVVTLEIE